MPSNGFGQISDNLNGGHMSNNPSSPQGQKVCDPDPIIEAIVTGHGYPELKFEIQTMLK